MVSGGRLGDTYRYKQPIKNMNILQEAQLKNLDVVIKYFFEYNNYTKISSVKNNGLHAGHLAILIALTQLIPPTNHKDYWVSAKCLQFQMWKSLNYTCSIQTVKRDIDKLVKLGVLKLGNTKFKFKTYQYNV